MKKKIQNKGQNKDEEGIKIRNEYGGDNEYDEEYDAEDDEVQKRQRH